MIPPNYPKTCEEILSQVTTVISQFWPCAAPNEVALNCIVRLICEVQTVDITLILPPFHPIWYLGLIFGAVIKCFATCFWHLSTSPTRDLESLLQLRLFLQEFLVHSTDKHWNPSGTPQQKPAWNIDLLSINWQIVFFCCIHCFKHPRKANKWWFPNCQATKRQLAAYFLAEMSTGQVDGVIAWILHAADGRDPAPGMYKACI